MILEPYFGFTIHVRLDRKHYYKLLTIMNEPDFDGDYVNDSNAEHWLNSWVACKITPG